MAVGDYGYGKAVVRRRYAQLFGGHRAFLRTQPHGQAAVSLYHRFLHGGQIKYILLPQGVYQIVYGKAQATHLLLIRFAVAYEKDGSPLQQVSQPQAFHGRHGGENFQTYQ